MADDCTPMNTRYFVCYSCLVASVTRDIWTEERVIETPSPYCCPRQEQVSKEEFELLDVLECALKGAYKA